MARPEVTVLQAIPAREVTIAEALPAPANSGHPPANFYSPGVTMTEPPTARNYRSGMVTVRHGHRA